MSIRGMREIIKNGEKRGMEMATAKIIELLLEDGTLEGLLTVQDSSWNGTMFVSPRDNINQLFKKKKPPTGESIYYCLIKESISVKLRNYKHV